MGEVWLGISSEGGGGERENTSANVAVRLGTGLLNMMVTRHSSDFL